MAWGHVVGDLTRVHKYNPINLGDVLLLLLLNKTNENNPIRLALKFNCLIQLTWRSPLQLYFYLLDETQEVLVAVHQNEKEC